MVRMKILVFLVALVLAVPVAEVQAGNFWENLIIGVIQGLSNAALNARIRSDLGAVDAHLAQGQTWSAQTQLVETRRYLMQQQSHNYRRLSEQLATVEQDIRSNNIHLARRRIAHILRHLPVAAPPSTGPTPHPPHPGPYPGPQPNPGHGDTTLYRMTLSRLQNAQHSLRSNHHWAALSELRAVENDFRWRTSTVDRQIHQGAQRVISSIENHSYQAAMAQLNGLVRTVQDAVPGSTWSPPPHHGHNAYERNRHRWANDLGPIISEVRDGRFRQARRSLESLINDVQRSSSGSSAPGSQQLRNLRRQLNHAASQLAGRRPDRREIMSQLRSIRRQLSSSSYNR